MLTVRLLIIAAVSLMLLSCGASSRIVIPQSDGTVPTNVNITVVDKDIATFTKRDSGPTIVAISDSITIVGGATDRDGGLKSVSIWASYTHFNPSMQAGPGLVGAPTAESRSSAMAGDTTLKTRLVSHTFDLQQDLGNFASMRVEIWVQAENFHGGVVRSPKVTISYPTKQNNDTDYMAQCRAESVPIPPDWAETGTKWELHGNLGLGHNILAPGDDAFVWTYSDPIREGACIALPRGQNGQRGGLAGIICQSARTGAACFWDSRLRDNANPMRRMSAINWKTEQPLRVSQLKDATNITEPGSGVCTECHRGDNVFLFAPDDVAWKEVLKVGAVSTLGKRFNTKVKSSSDVRNGKPRYVPLSGNRQGWDNQFSASNSSCNVCHETPNLSELTSDPNVRLPIMPPACATNGDVTKCYR